MSTSASYHAHYRQHMTDAEFAAVLHLVPPGQDPQVFRLAANRAVDIANKLIALLEDELNESNHSDLNREFHARTQVTEILTFHLTEWARTHGIREQSVYLAVDMLGGAAANGLED